MGVMDVAVKPIAVKRVASMDAATALWLSIWAQSSGSNGVTIKINHWSKASDIDVLACMASQAGLAG